MARRKNPLKGSVLNLLALFNAKPINRDARRIVEPLDPSRKKKNSKPESKRAKLSKIQREGKQPPLVCPRKQIFKKNGTIVQITGRPDGKA